MKTSEPVWVRSTSAAVLVIGVAVLIGWKLDVQPLKNIVPGLVNMKANTALGFTLLGIALLTLPRSGRTATLGRLAAIAVAVLGVATIAEYQGIGLGIDEVIARDGSSVGTAIGGRMAALTAVCFVAMGSGLAFIPAQRATAAHLADALLLLAGGIAFIAVAGYVYGVPDLYGFGQSTWMAIHTAVAFELGAAAGLGVDRRRGVFALLDRPSDGGLVARRLVPIIIGVPVGLGWLVLNAYRQELIGIEFAIASFALAVTLVLGVVAWVVAGSLDRMHAAHGEAQARSTVDALTGVLNRRGLDEGLRATHARAMRYGQRYSVLSADLNGLKAVNDAAGHAVGDAMIQAFGEALRRSTRDSDLVARIGGDEFAVVVLDTGTAGVRLIESKIRATFSERAASAGIPDASVAIGTAAHPEDGSSPDELLRVADSRMYEDKMNVTER